MYVAVVNYLVVRSLFKPVVPYSPSQIRSIFTKEISPSPPSTATCHDDTVYVALLVPPTTAGRDNAHQTTALMVKLRQSEHPNVAVHMLLVGVSASQMHTHRQWCTKTLEGLPCSIIQVEDADSRIVFRRILEDFPCLQDLVMIGATSHIDSRFFERLQLAPRDKVSCLSIRAGRCPAFRVSAAYMTQHQYGTDIMSGAGRMQAYYGALPVLT